MPLLGGPFDLLLALFAGGASSYGQWLVMRGNVQGSGIWIPANMLAWLFGMPIVFWAMDRAFKMPALWQSMSVIAGLLFVAGAVVGAIHGLFLVRLAHNNYSSQPA